MCNEELVERIQHGINVQEYMEQLYNQNKGFIFSVVKRYFYACRAGENGIPIIEPGELMNEAYFGLVEAVNRYNPDQGAGFLTYASMWVGQSIKHFLDNSGKTIRVPVHTQEKINRYNKVTAYFLSCYGREPSCREYASSIGISEQRVIALEKFMFQGAIKSLDAPLPGDSDETTLTIADSVADNVNVEADVIEKVRNEQIKEELWGIVNQVLKDETSIQIFRLMYEKGFTAEQIANQLQLSRSDIEHSIKHGIKQIKRNPRARDLGEELGLWCREVPIDAYRVKQWAAESKFDYLSEREVKYAVNMGWVMH